VVRLRLEHFDCVRCDLNVTHPRVTQFRGEAVVAYGKESGKLGHRADGHIPVFYTFDPYVSGTRLPPDGDAARSSCCANTTACTHRPYQHGCAPRAGAIHDVLLPLRRSSSRTDPSPPLLFETPSSSSPVKLVPPVERGVLLCDGAQAGHARGGDRCGRGHWHVPCFEMAHQRNKAAHRRSAGTVVCALLSLRWLWRSRLTSDISLRPHSSGILATSAMLMATSTSGTRTATCFNRPVPWLLLMPPFCTGQCS
jgi:hypothetical protein